VSQAIKSESILDTQFNLEKDLLYAIIFKHKEKNIIMAKYTEGAVIDETEAREIINSVQSYSTKGKYAYGITEVSKGAFVTESARVFFANDKFGQEETKAMAVIYNQLAQRLLITLYLKFNKPKTPLKTFKNRKKALDWLIKMGA
jgi:hypothetical protein